VAAAHTGPSGVEKAISERWRVIILDVMLPGCDGFEVLQQIRRRSDVPVLMLTARGDETDPIAGLEIGADDYLPKGSSMRSRAAPPLRMRKRHESPRTKSRSRNCASKWARVSRHSEVMERRRPRQRALQWNYPCEDAGARESTQAAVRGVA
jgi:DNA-binding response OmpR family regulator